MGYLIKLLHVMDHSRTRGHSLKLTKHRSILELRKKHPHLKSRKCVEFFDGTSDKCTKCECF